MTSRDKVRMGDQAVQSVAVYTGVHPADKRVGDHAAAYGDSTGSTSCYEPEADVSAGDLPLPFTGA
ncbi:hypothetical protein [Streptomyces malaysiense]|uniref:Uncharacterized protein n=1 Tax=Streptomyces malaysiense TaxID=1428626 RepID=A0A1J4Q767_9ACTN|nr:hypothetical protein [Streptomyces malaysiense]OIK27983.1 hypothetical protein VT52_008290 [Streptomyces malaysiense]